MTQNSNTEIRKMLDRLRVMMAEDAAGQTRLNRITQLIALEMISEVCSIYLFLDDDTLELCASEGLNPEAVHKTRLKLSEGLVGRVARTSQVINTNDAFGTRGFQYKPETGEDPFKSFLGVPIQRLGETLGVLTVQSKDARIYTEREVQDIQIVAMVIAEMTELGAFVTDNAAMSARHQQPALFNATSAQEGAAAGHVWLHNPRVIVTNPIASDPTAELERLSKAIRELRVGVDKILSIATPDDKEQLEVLEAYRMFASSKGWVLRMEDGISRGLSAEAAVEMEQSNARTRMSKVTDPYLRDRLHDLDDLSNRLLRILTGQGTRPWEEMPKDPVLVSGNIGPAELLDYGRKLKGIVLEEGSVGSHATIVARALAIPLVVRAEQITTEAQNGDYILVDGDRGVVHLRPDDAVSYAFRDKMAMQEKARERYDSIRDKPAITLCGHRINLYMNAGLMADLPSLEKSGAEGVGLFRTELQFLTRNRMPKRSDLSEIYARVLNAAKGRRVIFRTLDIGSDKVLPYLKWADEPNPALGWRAIRLGLDRPGVLRMQIQALMRAAAGRPLTIMFPFIAQREEFAAARKEVDKALERERILGHPLPENLEVGAMLETPSIAFSPDKFYKEVDFISIGGNDLKQFFFAADRQNELVRRRYDTLNVSFLRFISSIVSRCEKHGTPLSFCGEDAGRPVEAACFAAMGLRALSMRPASIGPVKSILQRIHLSELREIIDKANTQGHQSVRPAVMEYLQGRF
ncbi:MAG: phosphoenolpyruvate--protein phosphotransferase [Roseovarius sp.]|nr:phosphoenolpyruvate--protein phosphotransferase [Roseovarius sp.]MCY4291240.1 phosphoenolpyruvate--protein phosphotransferase [Roseovarius sp.]MCY4314860.1 phosphoenolpyruvate--protein phosphotransferase [Roseovarius sp.]